MESTASPLLVSGVAKWDRQLWKPLLSLKSIGIVSILFALPTRTTTLAPPPVVWIAVEPGTLSGNEGHTVAHKCQAILNDFGLNDVEVCLRESRHHWGTTSTFDTPISDATAEFRMPFTFPVGYPISTNYWPVPEGSLGLFFINGSDTTIIYFLTARHVAFPEAACSNNELYKYTGENQSRRDVTIFGEHGIVEHLNNIRIRIEEADNTAKRHQHRINTLEGKDDNTVKERKEAETEIAKLQEASEALKRFREHVSNSLHDIQSRTIGYIILSPPIAFAVGDDEYTEDWAIGRLEANRINVDTFFPNVLDLGFKFKSEELNALMNPNIRNPPSFEYPNDRLLRIYGIVPKAELQNPSDEDENGDPLLTAIKRGAMTDQVTDLTVGRVHTLASFVRRYGKGLRGTSMELAIHGLEESGRFADHGDSGSFVVDGKGRVVGMITGGVGDDGFDVTYVTPAEFIFDQIRSYGFNPNINFRHATGTS